jgi:hypothetical protein
MRGLQLPKYILGNRGFALIVAVAVIAILISSGVVLQRTVFEEVWDARQSVARTKARLAVTAGLEAALGQLDGFLGREDPQQTIMGKVQQATYQVTMRKAKVAQFGSALSWLSPDELLIELSIIGVQPTQTGAKSVLGEEVPPEFLQKATVIVDPEKIPCRIVLWMWE